MSDEEEQHDSGCASCGRHVEPAWHLCERCSSSLADSLLEIASRYARVTAVPSSSPGRYDQTRSAKPGSRPPLSMAAAEIRDDRSGAVDKLDQWAWRICVERGYETSPDKTVDGAVEFLNRHDDWIARWPRAGELCATVRKLRNHLRALTGEPNPKPIGYCFRNVDRTDQNERDRLEAAGFDPDECSGAIFLPDRGEGDEYTPVVRCNGHERHEYGGLDLARLKVHIDNEQRKKQEQRDQDRQARLEAQQEEEAC